MSKCPNYPGLVGKLDLIWAHPRKKAPPLSRPVRAQHRCATAVPRGFFLTAIVPAEVGQNRN